MIQFAALGTTEYIVLIVALVGAFALYKVIYMIAYKASRQAIKDKSEGR